MNRRTAVLLAGALAAAATASLSPLSAQESDGNPLLRSGQRVRIETTASRDHFDGILLVRADSGLTVARDDRTLFVAASEVERLELSLGFRNEVGPMARNGAIGGGVFGLVMGVAASQDDSGWFEIGAAEVALVTVVTAGMGAVVGALVGLAQSGEDWMEVEYPERDRVALAVVPAPRGTGLALGVALRR